MGATVSKICSSDQENAFEAERDEIGDANNAETKQEETIQNAKISQPVPREKSLNYNIHKFEEIMKKVDNPIMGDVNDKIRSGIFLDRKKKKFWIEENGNNCFMLFARDLTIEWGDKQRYWHWISENETIDTQIEVAELKGVCWLEIRAKLEVSLLTPKITYQVFFIVKIKESSYGWKLKAVKIQLKLPDGTIKKCQEKLDEKPKEKWIQIKAGEFEIQVDEKGELEIGLFEWDNPSWKGGIVIKGAMICP